jgi:hypothetical protein
MSNGHIVEIQIHSEQILKAKKVDDARYQEIRDIEGRARFEDRELTLDEWAVIEEFMSSGASDFSRAYEEFVGGEE